MFIRQTWLLPRAKAKAIRSKIANGWRHLTEEWPWGLATLSLAMSNVTLVGFRCLTIDNNGAIVAFLSSGQTQPNRWKGLTKQTRTSFHFVTGICCACLQNIERPEFSWTSIFYSRFFDRSGLARWMLATNALLDGGNVSKMMPCTRKMRPPKATASFPF